MLFDCSLSQDISFSPLEWTPRSRWALCIQGYCVTVVLVAQLWEVYNERRCLRTFLGHGKAVRDISFNLDGSKFLSCSYDRYVKLWDTETGKWQCFVGESVDIHTHGLVGSCIGRFGNGKTPYCVRFNPDEDKQNLFLSGCSDKKIYAVSVCVWSECNVCVCVCVCV